MRLWGRGWARWMRRIAGFRMRCAPSESGLACVHTQQRESLEYWVTEHLRVSGLYWGSTALALLGKDDALNKDDVVAFLKRCAHKEGAFFWPC